MKIDYKKIKPIVLTYASLSAPIAITAFAMNASTTVKILSFLSGFLAVATRQANPKDPFTLNILAVAKTQVDAEIAKKSTKKK
jgi:hypothetical protein